MGDHSDDDDSQSNLLNQIKQLEKEKADIERNREREALEQKLKELKGTVSQLKGNTPVASSPNQGSSSSSGRRSRKDASPNVQEALNRIKNKLDTSLQSDEASDSNNESDKSSEEEEAEEVMSAQHKQKIQKNRDTLVENMIPDDIFNDLISGKVLTTADVSRIKKKVTRESINEELLNNLVLKSDRAFFVFTRSLRKTLQEYLANLLEPPSKAKKKKRKRQQKEMNISLDVDQIIPTNRNKPPQCTCQEVEEQILMMSKNAYKNIRRRDESASAFEQFRKELASTNTVIKDSMEIMNTLKILCRHGDITGINRGSVKFTMRFKSLEDLTSLWTIYKSGELLVSIQTTLVTSKFKHFYHARDIKLGLRISEEEYKMCHKELSVKKESGRKKPSKKDKSTSHVEKDPSLDIENSPSPKLLTYPTVTHYHHRHRRAFHELPKNVVSTHDDQSVKGEKTRDKYKKLSI